MSVNVDLDKLKGFVAVGEELHFTRAAQTRLHVSQPWLSRSVKSLEQKLGVQLFERHSRHVELTAPGRRLLYGARKLIHDFDRTVSAVVQERKGSGNLIVGYSLFVDLHFIASLRQLSLPGSRPTTISLESSSSEDAAQQVRNREWDCGIVILPVDTQDLEIIQLFPVPLAGAMRKTHRLARRRALNLEDLRDEPLILAGKRRESQFRGWLLNRFSEAGIAPKVVEEAASPHEAQYLVTRGLGIAVANAGAFRTSLEGIIVRPFPSESLEMYTAIVIRKGKRSPVVAGFVDRVVEMAKAQGRSRPATRSAV